MEQPMNRNGSGYIDTTAYEAMKNVMKGNEKMKTGEIWEVLCSNNSKTDYALIVADHGNVCTILKLSGEGYNTDIPINCFGIKYVNCGMLSYAFEDRMCEFVRKTTESEFEEVMKNVAIRLGIEQKVIEKEVPIEVVKEVPVPSSSGDFEEIAKLKAEAEIYKGMYERLLNSVIGKDVLNG